MTCSCAACGKVFEAARKSRQFCSDACRKRASRGNVIAIARQPKRQAASGSARGSVQVATRTQLDEMGFSDSPLGSLALALAERIDVGNETGAATAALARELRATMESIESKVPSPTGKVSSMRLKLMERAGHGA